MIRCRRMRHSSARTDCRYIRCTGGVYYFELLQRHRRWILKYIASYVTTAAAPDFNAFIGSSEPVIWHIVFMAATIAVCYFGINGIEKASKLMMPMLLVLLFVIIFRSVTLPGASKDCYLSSSRIFRRSRFLLSARHWDRCFIP